ncbi:hypothetical protein Rin_00001750 [Candidatus Regiella insecticola 5.15]|uniref:Uncharacterized protein n=2 Tax=Candidatus Regiella insecticola TaxID=138073 RepID=G2GWP0_9ENTR|nr:type III secretion system domain-containing protein [Candidatus Regiella insecticola]EGY29852.1 hypothetical protein Rin_00001750 [Candidatus Regiella insecticola 5.15]
MLRDFANTRSQQHGGFKGEGYSPIDEKIVRLHQLAWQPARFAHPAWLMKMGLRSEKYHYGDCQTLDNILNRQLIDWRGFPKQPLPAVLTNKQKAQMALEPRLDAVCMALGLVSLRCSDYLRIRHYRQALYPILNDEDVCQLLGIGCPGERAAILSPEILPSIALQLGRGILHATSSAAITWQALSILLPPLPRAIWLPSADLWLARLERLL